MILSNDEFQKIVKKNYKVDSDLLLELLKKILKNKDRFINIFKYSSFEDAIIGNLIQSNEIKYGNFIEQVVEKYIASKYHIEEKKLENKLECDHLFINQTKTDIYLVEQKMRDDHDNSAINGHIKKIRDKYNIISIRSEGMKIHPIFWYVDEKQKKHGSRVRNEINDLENSQVLYGEEFFTYIFDNGNQWEEFYNYIDHFSKNKNTEITKISKFKSKRIILDALCKMSISCFEKLLRDTDREIIFSVFNITNPILCELKDAIKESYKTKQAIDRRISLINEYCGG